MSIDPVAGATAFLRSQGITAASTVAAFRIGDVDDATLVRLGLVGRCRPGGRGLSIPTWLPSDPTPIVGLIRAVPAQNKHYFLTEPMGIAGSPEVLTTSRIVLVDTPLLALRLHQSGARGIALIEDPVVLPPLLPWLTGREVVLVGWRKDRLDALRNALGPLGTAATTLTVGSDLIHSPDASLLALGIDPATVKAKPEKSDLTAIHLRDLVDYARGRLGSGEATAALEAVEAHIPAVVQAYRIGFLPTTFRTSLHRRMRSALEGSRIAGALILPAYDETGVAVDVLVVQPRVGGRSNDGIAPTSLGLLAPEISRSHDEIIVTDTFRWLARLMRDGYTNVQLLRGLDDARCNAARIATAGVRRAIVRTRHHRDRYAEILHGAGITVSVIAAPVTPDGEWDAVGVQPEPFVPAAEPIAPMIAPTVQEPAVVASPLASAPAPTSPPIATVTADSTLRWLEDDAAVILFAAGPAQYAVERRDDGDTRRYVTVRNQGQSHRDRFDLSSAPQRARFASGAARRVSIPAPVLEQHLVALLDGVRQREDAALLAPALAVDPTARLAAETLLAKPDLLDRIADDLTALGWVGEARAKRLLYLTGISRLLPHPLWSVYGATTGGAPWQGLTLIGALTPPEDCIVLHRLTEAILAHTGPAGLRHKLLLVDQAETLRPEAALALRVLHERGAIGWATLAPSTATPGQPLLGDARGPIAVLAAAAGPLDRRMRDCFLAVGVDETPASTVALLADHCRRYGSNDSLSGSAHVETIISRHHALSRVLERGRRVVIPFAERIAFPSRSVRHRHEHLCFLALIEASAYLHQRQRTRDGDAILASETDFEIAAALANGLLGTGGDGLSTMGRNLLSRVVAAGLTEFGIPDLAGLFPDESPWHWHAAIRELRDLTYVDAVKGRAAGRYRLTARAAAAAHPPGITLRPVGSGGQEGRMRPFEKPEKSHAIPDVAVG